MYVIICQERAFHQDIFLVVSSSACTHMLESLGFVGNLEKRCYFLVLVYFYECNGARIPGNGMSLKQNFWVQ